jgi:putative ABC transport system permease protein
VLAESLAIAIVGGLLGLLLAVLAIPVLANALNGMLPQLVLAPSVFALGFLTALAVGLASGLLPGLGAMRLQIVSALRRV